MAYTADINIVVKGQAAVNKLQQDLETLARKLDDITKRRIGPSTALETFNAQLDEAKRRLNQVAAGTNAETEAIKNYVTALGNANAASTRQNKLIQEEINLREAATGQVEKLAARQAEFTERTNESAQAAHRQTAEFVRQQRIAKQVAALNAAAPPAQLLLSAAAPGAPAMSGGARRLITGPVERLGGARTEDEAAMALRFAQALQEQVRPLSQIDALYAGIAGQAAKLQKIKALPDSAMLNASARGIQQLELSQDRYNRELKESADRIQELDRLEESRARRARKLQDRQAYFSGEPTAPAATGTGGFGAAMRGRAGGAISSAIIGGGFPLLFGQGPGAAAGGALGGLAGGLLGGGFGFALSIAGTALGDLITQSEALDASLGSLNSSLSTTGSTSTTTSDDIKQLAKTLQITNDEAVTLVGTFSQFGDAQTREALAALFGGVGGASTFEAIARAGIDEKNALAAVFELRKYIGTEAASQLALQLDTVGATQTQATLLKLVVERSIAGVVATKSQVKYTDNLLSVWENIVAGIAGALSLAIQFVQKMREGSLLKLPFLDQIANVLSGIKARSGKQIAAQNAAEAEKQLRSFVENALKGLQQETQALGLQSSLQESAKPTKKGPESRVVELKAEYDALVLIGNQENAIRDLLFQGKELKAVDAELASKLAVIERERVQALSKANYQEDKNLINKTAAKKVLYAQAEAADKIRDINQKRFEEELQNQQAIRDSVKVFTDLSNEQKLQAQYGKTYSRLINEGILPAEAERRANYEKLVTQKLKELEVERILVESAIEKAKQEGLATDALEKRLNLLKGQQKAVGAAAAAGPGPGMTDAARLKEAATSVRGELNTLLDPISQITAAAEGIGSAFSESFKGVVSGAMSAQEALAGFFQSVADHFLDMAAQIIAKWIEMTILNTVLSLFPGSPGSSTSFLFGADSPDAIAGGGIFSGAGPYQFRANGGSVNSGTPYMVGEQGPELFVPGKSGTIVPNNALGGSSSNVVVNVDASGSTVQGDATKASQLGNALAAAVQAELIKQKRPGGLLA